MLRISFQEMKSEFERVLLARGFTPEKAVTLAEVFAVNSLEGVYSHGANRFPRFIQNIAEGKVIVDAEPVKVSSFAALEQWNGNLGPGILNALAMAGRSRELAREYGIGCVGLAHTNHWLRAGTFGRKTAGEGFIYIGWTNTMPNMPAWGAVDCRLGNNPLVLAVPGKDGPVVLDMAMSQYSYGKMEVYKQNDRQLPVPGGFNDNGELSTDPGEILQSGRALSVGYWKGAGLAILLDMIAVLVSGGLATHHIGLLDGEYDISQVFISIDIQKFHSAERVIEIVQDIVSDVKSSHPADPSTIISYPGERVMSFRQENLDKGIPVNPDTWKIICGL